MARRIVLTVVALISALLVTTVVPLGLLTTGRERDTFREDTVLSARALAAVAEENLTDHRATPALASSLARMAGTGDRVWVYDKAGRLVAVTGGASGSDSPVPQSEIAAVLRHRGPPPGGGRGRARGGGGGRRGGGGPPAGGGGLRGFL